MVGPQASSWRSAQHRRGLAGRTDDEGQTVAPQGQFASVIAGVDHSCAITAEATLTCWGINPDSQLDAPDTTFSVIDASVSQTCGVRSDRRIVCWG